MLSHSIDTETAVKVVSKAVGYYSKYTLLCFKDNNKHRANVDPPEDSTALLCGKLDQITFSRSLVGLSFQLVVNCELSLSLYNIYIYSSPCPGLQAGCLETGEGR